MDIPQIVFHMNEKSDNFHIGPQRFVIFLQMVSKFPAGN